MAIVRLSIEVLQGRRDGDDPESRATAVAALKNLTRAAKDTGITLYPESEKAPWGVPMRPDTFNLDFDTDLGAEDDADLAALALVHDFLAKGSEAPEGN